MLIIYSIRTFAYSIEHEQINIDLIDRTKKKQNRSFILNLKDNIIYFLTLIQFELNLVHRGQYYN